MHRLKTAMRIIHETVIRRAAVIVDLAAEKVELDFRAIAAAEWAVAAVEAAAAEGTMKR